VAEVLPLVIEAIQDGGSSSKRAVAACSSARPTRPPMGRSMSAYGYGTNTWCTNTSRVALRGDGYSL
jgi:hypothetical protein